MGQDLELEILPQPDDTTCGPTCLHAVYRYFEDIVPLETVIREVPRLSRGGTLAVLMGCHALSRGYRVTIYTYNLKVFDPTWFSNGAAPARHSDSGQATLIDRLKSQMLQKSSTKLQTASEGYMQFLGMGGQIRMQDLNEELLRGYLQRSIPILTGLSATYLYGSAREYGRKCVPDDIRGQPTGHFVVVSGLDQARNTVRIADPLHPNPLGDEQYYEVGFDRLVCAILLGVLTYDANFLVIEPGSSLGKT
jgi:hypothetical protein